jgi:hypothetical protein
MIGTNQLIVALVLIALGAGLFYQIVLNGY